MVYEGNIEAYDKLHGAYDIEIYRELLPYTLIMANKYDYHKAFYDTFDILINIDGCSVDYDLDCLDKKSKQMALAYLRMAIEKGNDTASDIFLSFYKDQDLYTKEINEGLIIKSQKNLDQ